MELWFVLALISAFSAGVSAFAHKVIAMRDSDIFVLNVYASIISITILFFLTWYFTGFSVLLSFATLIAFGGAIVYLLTLFLKVESLKEIDSAIFFPLYKVSGPLIVIFIGVFLFAESFSHTEWLGLGLSLLVPLMLITRSENARQKNLLRGISILLLAAITGSISISIHKYGVSISENIWLYLLISELFGAAASIAILVNRYRSNLSEHVSAETNIKSLQLALIMGVASATTGATMFFAFAIGGTLSIVYTISSLYILIPIVLSIIFYKEHWNARKIIAIVLSVAALGLLK